MLDIFEESARLREAAKQRLDIPLLGSEWSAPQCAFFGAVVPGQENQFRVVWFDAIGFSGHVETNTPQVELLEMFGVNVERYDGALDYVSKEW